MVRGQLAALAAAATLALGTGADAAVPPGAWHVLHSVSQDPTQVDNSTLASVSMTSARDGWTVGAFMDPRAVSRPLAEHWDGRAWRITANAPLPKGAASAELSGVDQLSTASAWAVGNRTLANGGARTLVEHFTGTSWAAVPSPDPFTGFGADDRLNGIGGTSAHDLWAVGFAFDGNVISLMLIEHFNGTQWQNVAPPAVGGFPDLVSVSADSPSDAWAVGTTATPNDTSLAVHWNGHAWTVVAVPCLQGDAVSVDCTAINILTGVSAPAASNVWVSGYEEGSSGSFVPYVLHWNGQTWSLTKTPNPGQVGSSLRGIIALSPGDVWAVGQTQTDGNSVIATLTEHFDGHAWSVVPSPDPGLLGNDSLDGVASAAGGQLFAVGADSQSGQCCLRTLALRHTTS
jgi:hypothetical protein